MGNSVLQDVHGPDWPLGFIAVATPGTPVGIMSVVDSSNNYAPATATGSSANVHEYTARFKEIIFQACKPAGNGTQLNTGNVYLVRTGGNRSNYGTILQVLGPGSNATAGTTFTLKAAETDQNVLNGYRYALDADNANDGAIVTALVCG